MCDRRRKCGRFFDRNTNLAEKLFVRRQNTASTFDEDDIEEIFIDGKTRKNLSYILRPFYPGLFSVFTLKIFHLMFLLIVLKYLIVTRTIFFQKRKIWWSLSFAKVVGAEPPFLPQLQHLQSELPLLRALLLDVKGAEFPLVQWNDKPGKNFKILGKDTS